MNILEHTDHSEKKHHIEYFVHLVRVALADDVITVNEMELLNRIGGKLGLTELEIDNLVKITTKSDYIPPYELSARFEQVYDIVKMTLADEVIDKNEMRLANNFASKSGFNETEIPALLLLLINGIRQGIDHDDLFETYKKERRSRK